MPLFKRKIPPLWYVMYPSPTPSSSTPPKREGPYTRAVIAQLLSEGRLSNGALLWTNECIFPNAKKPLSSRLVRIPEWRRLDQLPDPVVRQLEADGQALSTPPTAHPDVVQTDEQPPQQLTAAEMHKIQQQQQQPHHHPPPPPAGGSHAPAPGAYPAGTYTDGHESHHYPPSNVHETHAPHTQHPGPGPYPQPGAYPQPGVYPAGASSTAGM